MGPGKTTECRWKGSRTPRGLGGTNILHYYRLTTQTLKSARHTWTAAGTVDIVLSSSSCRAWGHPHER